MKAVPLLVTSIALLLAFVAADTQSTAGTDLVSSSRSRHRRRPQHNFAVIPPNVDPSASTALYPKEDEQRHDASSLARFDLPLRSAVQFALAAIAVVIAIQTLAPLDFMPESIKKLLASWVQQRVEHNLSVVSIGAFFMYAASDALSQCVSEVVRSRREDAVCHADERQRLGSRSSGSGGSSREVTSETVSRGPGGERRIVLDTARMARSGFTSGLLSGFLAVFYFAWLDRTWRSENVLSWFPGSASAGACAGEGAAAGCEHMYGEGAQRLAEWACVAGKVATDVGVYEPIFDTIYITLQALLRGEGLEAARAEVAAKVLRVWAMAPRYWTFVDAINFSVVSLRLRPLTNALMSIPWSMYISSMANSPT